MSELKCYVCGISIPLTSNNNTDGWAITDDGMFCPTCVRIRRVEETLFKCQFEIQEAVKNFKSLVATLHEAIAQASPKGGKDE